MYIERECPIKDVSVDELSLSLTEKKLTMNHWLLFLLATVSLASGNPLTDGETKPSETSLLVDSEENSMTTVTVFHLSLASV